jgi:predicted  nucleic acid-binding Zn-ribbon protein
VADCASKEEPAQVTSALAAIGGAVLARRLTPHGAEAQAEAAALKEEVASLRRVVADRDAHIVQLRERHVDLERRLQERETALERQVAELGQMLADTSLRALIKRTTRGKLG